MTTFIYVQYYTCHNYTVMLLLNRTEHY